MAISALNVYAAGQNGNTETTRLPDGKPDYPDFRLPSWMVGTREGQEPIAPNTLNLPTTAAPVEAPPVITLQPTAKPSLAKAKTTLNDLVERYKAQWNNLALGTRTKMECHFVVAARHLNFEREVAGIKLADLRELKSKLSDGRKASSVNDILFKGLSALFKIALEDEIIERNPLERLARGRRGEIERTQPNWEQARLIEAEADRYASESAIIIGFMRNFGVGQAEVRYLNGENVDSGKGIIHFRRKKTGKPFEIPIFQHAHAFIEKLKNTGRLQIGRPVVQWRNPRKALATACERLGFPRYEPRALRRSFIIHCLEQGIDPRVVAKWQGHADAKLIFSVYGKFIDQGYERAQAGKLNAGSLNPIPKSGPATN